MLFGAQSEFGFVAGSHLATRPAAAFGTTLTGGVADTYGSYVEVLSDASITEDCYGILINVNNISGAAPKSATLTIGKDEAGGTSYVDWLTHLLCGDACAYTNMMGGIFYYFPMYIKAGTALAAKVASVNASATISCNLTVYGRPKNPGAVKCASKFESFGASAGNGTALTPGEAAEGAWTQMGSNPSTPLWWWQMGWQCDDTTMGNTCFHVDLARGDASNKHIITENMVVLHDSAEFLGGFHYPTPFCGHDVTAADLLYMRGQCQTTTDATIQTAAYGVG